MHLASGASEEGGSVRKRKAGISESSLGELEATRGAAGKVETGVQ